MICSGNRPSFLSDIALSIRPSFRDGTSLTIHSYPNPTHPIQDQESDPSRSFINTAALPYNSLDENYRPPTPTVDPYLYPLRLDNQRINHPTPQL